MVIQKQGNTEKGFKSEEDMPHRVAPRLEGVVKNRGLTKKGEKKSK